MTDEGGDPGPTDDWERLAQHVIAGRVRLGHQVRGSFARAAQINVRVLGDIEKARRTNYDPATLARLEQSLGWETGSVRAVLRGGTPTLTGESTDTPAGDRAVIHQIIAILDEDRYGAGTRLAMIRDVIDRDFVNDGDGHERLSA